MGQPEQQQEPPGTERQMEPVPGHGPIWAPLIPSTMPAEHVGSFGQQVPLGRAGQPAEVAPAFVLLASDEASYISGARLAVTGGKPVL